jgi:hypothetical protein
VQEGIFLTTVAVHLFLSFFNYLFIVLFGQPLVAGGGRGGGQT